MLIVDNSINYDIGVYYILRFDALKRRRFVFLQTKLIIRNVSDLYEWTLHMVIV